jgi:hypothetical protein
MTSPLLSVTVTDTPSRGRFVSKLTTAMRIPPSALCAIAAGDAQMTSTPAKSWMIRFMMISSIRWARLP